MCDARRLCAFALQTWHCRVRTFVPYHCRLGLKVSRKQQAHRPSLAAHIQPSLQQLIDARRVDGHHCGHFGVLVLVARANRCEDGVARVVRPLLVDNTDNGFLRPRIPALVQTNGHVDVRERRWGAPAPGSRVEAVGYSSVGCPQRSMVATIDKPLHNLVSVAESCDSLLNRKRQAGKVYTRVADQDLLGRRCSKLSLGVAQRVAAGRPTLSPPQGKNSSRRAQKPIQLAPAMRDWQPLSLHQPQYRNPSRRPPRNSGQSLRWYRLQRGGVALLPVACYSGSS